MSSEAKVKIEFLAKSLMGNKIIEESLFCAWNSIFIRLPSLFHIAIANSKTLRGPPTVCKIVESSVIPRAILSLPLQHSNVNSHPFCTPIIFLQLAVQLVSVEDSAINIQFCHPN